MAAAASNSHGLLRASFRPKGQIAELRAYVRQRERLLEYAASHIQHMQKALTEMNLQLHHVVADITGTTGLRIIRAIFAGERDPEVLARLRHYSCHSSTETIVKALTGSYRAEHLFALEQALALYDVYHEKASACDVRIEAVLNELSIDRGRFRIKGVVDTTSEQNRSAECSGFRRARGAVCAARKGHHDDRRSRSLPFAEVDRRMRRRPLLLAECKAFYLLAGLGAEQQDLRGQMLSSRTRRSGGRAAALLRLTAVTV